jgi:hypothetical protein
MMSEEGDETSAEEIANEAGEIVCDLPCGKCGYNLRGLMVDGKCPECGESVEESVTAISEWACCLQCMCPNPPSQANCKKCGAPITGAAPWGWAAASSAPPVEGPPPRAWRLLGVVICATVIVAMLTAIARMIAR